VRGSNHRTPGQHKVETVRVCLQMGNGGWYPPGQSIMTAARGFSLVNSNIQFEQYLLFVCSRAHTDCRAAPKSCGLTLCVALAAVPPAGPEVAAS
jgi:hypothetical protein